MAQAVGLLCLAALLAIGHSMDCDREDDVRQIVDCLDPFLADWEAKMGDGEKEVIPVLHYTREELLELCTSYERVSSLCFTSELQQHCTNSSLVRSVKALGEYVCEIKNVDIQASVKALGEYVCEIKNVDIQASVKALGEYVCEIKNVDIQARFECIRGALDEKPICKRLIAEMKQSADSSTDAKCDRMESFFSCLQGSIYSGCGVWGVAVLVQAVDSLGCRVPIFKIADDGRVELVQGPRPINRIRAQERQEVLAKVSEIGDPGHIHKLRAPGAPDIPQTMRRQDPALSDEDYSLDSPDAVVEPEPEPRAEESPFQPLPHSEQVHDTPFPEPEPKAASDLDDYFSEPKQRKDYSHGWGRPRSQESEEPAAEPLPSPEDEPSQSPEDAFTAELLAVEELASMEREARQGRVVEVAPNLDGFVSLEHVDEEALRDFEASAEDAFRGAKRIGLLKETFPKSSDMETPEDKAAVLVSDTCDTEEDDIALAPCLKPWFDVWQGLKENSEEPGELFFPALFYSPEHILRMCDAYTGLLETCLSDSVIERCQANPLLSFIHGHVGYVCSVREPNVLAHLACMSATLEETPACRDIVKSLTVQQIQKNRCAVMPGFYACLEGPVGERCGTRGLSILTQAIGAFGCSLGLDQTSTTPQPKTVRIPPVIAGPTHFSAEKAAGVDFEIGTEEAFEIPVSDLLEVSQPRSPKQAKPKPPKAEPKPEPEPPKPAPVIREVEEAFSGPTLVKRRFPLIKDSQTTTSAPVDEVFPEKEVAEASWIVPELADTSPKQLRKLIHEESEDFKTEEEVAAEYDALAEDYFQAKVSKTQEIKEELVKTGAKLSEKTLSVLSNALDRPKKPSKQPRKAALEVCSKEDKELITECFIPLNQKWNKMITDSPRVHSVVFPLFRYQKWDVFELCNMRLVAFKDCLKPAVLRRCIKDPIIDIVESLLGYACGAAKKDFFMAHDCVHGLEKDAASCYAHIAVQPRPGLSISEKCSGVPAFYTCLKGVVEMSCPEYSQTLAHVVASLKQFGCHARELPKANATTEAPREPLARSIKLARAPPTQFTISDRQTLLRKPLSPSKKESSKKISPQQHMAGIKSDAHMASLAEETSRRSNHSAPTLTYHCTPQVQNYVTSCLLPLVGTWTEFRGRREVLAKTSFPLYFYTRPELLEMCEAYANAFLRCDFPIFHACLQFEVVRFSLNHLGQICKPENLDNFMEHFDCVSGVMQEMQGSRCLAFVQQDPDSPSAVESFNRCSGMPSFYRCAHGAVRAKCGTKALASFHAAIREVGCSLRPGENLLV